MPIKRLFNHDYGIPKEYDSRFGWYRDRNPNDFWDYRTAYSKLLNFVPDVRRNVERDEAGQRVRIVCSFNPRVYVRAWFHQPQSLPLEVNKHVNTIVLTKHTKFRCSEHPLVDLSYETISLDGEEYWQGLGDIYFARYLGEWI